MNREKVIENTKNRIVREISALAKKHKLLEPTEIIEVIVRIVPDPKKIFRRAGGNSYFHRELTADELEEIRNLPWSHWQQKVVDLIIGKNSNQPTKEADMLIAAEKEFFYGFNLGPTLVHHDKPFRLIETSESKSEKGEDRLYRFFRLAKRR